MKENNVVTSETKDALSFGSKSPVLSVWYGNHDGLPEEFPYSGGEWYQFWTFSSRGSEWVSFGKFCKCTGC